MNKVNNRIFLVSILLLTGLIFSNCKRADFKPSTISFSIAESKQNKVFLAEYKVYKYFDSSKIDFDYNEIWLEREWESYLDKNDQEKINISSDSTYRLIINFKDPRLSDKDFGKYFIEDEEGTGMGFYGGEKGGVMYLESNILKSQPSILRLNIIKVVYGDNRDTIKVGTLIFKKIVKN